jgi:hypothetical protein
MNKIGGSVERVDDPGGLVGEVCSGAESGGRLLPDELVAREVLPEVVKDKVLAAFVRLRNQIHLPPETNNAQRSDQRIPIQSKAKQLNRQHITGLGGGRKGEEEETWPLCSTFFVL